MRTTAVSYSSAPSAGWPLLLRRLEYIAYPAAAGAAFPPATALLLATPPRDARIVRVGRRDGCSRDAHRTADVFDHRATTATAAATSFPPLSSSSSSTALTRGKEPLVSKTVTYCSPEEYHQLANV